MNNVAQIAYSEYSEKMLFAKKMQFSVENTNINISSKHRRIEDVLLSARRSSV